MPVEMRAWDDRRGASASRDGAGVAAGRCLAGTAAPVPSRAVSGVPPSGVLPGAVPCPGRRLRGRARYSATVVNTA